MRRVKCSKPDFRVRANGRFSWICLVTHRTSRRLVCIMLGCYVAKVCPVTWTDHWTSLSCLLSALSKGRGREGGNYGFGMINGYTAATFTAKARLRVGLQNS